MKVREVLSEAEALGFRCEGYHKVWARLRHLGYPGFEGAGAAPDARTACRPRTGSAPTGGGADARGNDHPGGSEPDVEYRCHPDPHSSGGHGHGVRGRGSLRRRRGHYPCRSARDTLRDAGADPPWHPGTLRPAGPGSRCSGALQLNPSVGRDEELTRNFKNTRSRKASDSGR